MIKTFKRQRLIISDLDGTLLDSNESISERTVSIIKKITAQGHIFCLSTGRPIRSCIQYYKQLGLDTILCCLNGSIISNPAKPNDFMAINLTYGKHILLEILNTKIITEKMNYIVVETFDNAYIFLKNKDIQISEEFLEMFHLKKSDLKIITDFSKKSIEKIKYEPNSILISINEKDIDNVSFKIKSIASTLVVRSWSLNTKKHVIIEINSLYSNKGNALKFLSAYYGIPIRNTYVFGDGNNDIDMMKLTTRSFAMKNAESIAKLFSYKITEFDNDNDGVANELLKELKIKL